jgi:hypothetical protein
MIRELNPVVRLSAAMEAALAGAPMLRQIQALGTTLRPFIGMNKSIEQIQQGQARIAAVLATNSESEEE